MNRKGFTLVEVLAVITILAIILVIAVPKISDIVSISKEGTFKTNVEEIVKLVKLHYQENYGSSLNSDDIVYKVENNKITQNNEDLKLSSKIGNLNGTITINRNGKVNLAIKDSNYCGLKTYGGSLTIHSLSDDNTCIGYSDAVQVLKSKNTSNNTEGLITDDYGDIRYQGGNDIVKNYVYFNCSDMNNPTEDTCEVWRIIGVFDVDGEKRIKLIRNESIGSYSWDTSAEGVNSGRGINQWGPSKYTNGDAYEGADLMRELNGDYLNVNLTVNTNWYNGQNNTIGNVFFDKNKVLKESSQNMIGNAIWYLGGSETGVSLSIQYLNERGLGANGFMHISNPEDLVIRTNTWTGKVGLMYPSDYGYASANTICKDNLVNADNCKDQNWLFNDGYQWAISPSSPHTNRVQYVRNVGFVNHNDGALTFEVRPSVYLISDIQTKGSGTTSDPYVFVK